MKKIIFILFFLVPISVMSQQKNPLKDTTKIKKEIIYTWKGKIVSKEELLKLMDIHFLQYVDTAYRKVKKPLGN